jgi:hypothetical protein
MGLGSTAKKLQKLADRAEQLYAQLQDLRERMTALEASAQETSERTGRIERELDGQRALLKAVAEEQGLDPEQVLAEAAIEDADAAEESETTPTTADNGTTNSTGTGER